MRLHQCWFASLFVLTLVRPLAAQAVDRIIPRASRLVLMVGRSDTVRLEYRDRAGKEVPAWKVKPVFRSSDTSLAEVNSAGAVRGRRAGSGKVRAQVGEKFVFIQVTISDIPPAPELPPVTGFLHVPQASVLLIPGEGAEIHGTFRRSDGLPAGDVLVTYSSTDPAKATVDSLTGRVSAMIPGTVAILLKAPGTQPVPVNVIIGEPTMTISTDSLFLIEGTPDTLRLLVTSQKLREYQGAVTWESSNANVARVNPLGVVVGVTRGVAKITATTSYYTGETWVQVFPPAMARSTLSPDSAVILPLGTMTDLAIRGVTVDGNPLYTIPATWTVGDTTIAWYDRVNHQLVARGRGHTSLTGVPRISSMNRPRTWKVEVFQGTLVPEVERIGLRLGMKQGVAGILLDTAGVRVNQSVILRWDETDATGVQVSGSGAISVTAPGRFNLTGRAPWGAAVSVAVFGLPDLLFSEADGKGSIVQGMMLALGQRVPQPILRGAAVNMQPVVSPDRTRMVFTTNRANRDYDLWMADPDGGNERVLLRAVGSDIQPVWFPSGGRIAFTAARPGKSPQIYSIRPDGTGLTRLTDSLLPAGVPALSPDGNRIAYESLHNEQYDILYRRLQGDSIVAGGREQPLVASPDNERSPQFFPTGDLAYIKEEAAGKHNRILMRLINGSQVAQALTTPDYYIKDFAISPDGQQVVFSAPPQGVRSASSKNLLYLLDLRLAGTPIPSMLYASPSGSVGTPAFVP